LIETEKERQDEEKKGYAAEDGISRVVVDAMIPAGGSILLTHSPGAFAALR